LMVRLNIDVGNCCLVNVHTGHGAEFTVAVKSDLVQVDVEAWVRFFIYLMVVFCDFVGRFDIR